MFLSQFGFYLKQYENTTSYEPQRHNGSDLYYHIYEKVFDDLIPAGTFIISYQNIVKRTSLEQKLHNFRETMLRCPVTNVAAVFSMTVFVDQILSFHTRCFRNLHHITND